MQTNRLYLLRTENNLTQCEVANALKIPLSTYRRYESGKSKLKTHVLLAAALYYRTSADYIVELTDVKTPHP